MEKDILSKITQGKWESDIFGNVTNHPTRKGWKFMLPDFGIIAKFYGKNACDNAALAANAPETLRQRNALLKVCKDIVRAKCLIIPNGAEVPEENQGEVQALSNLFNELESVIKNVEDSR